MRPKVTYLIRGDLNKNLLNKTNNDTIKLGALKNTFNLKQVVNFPTRMNINNGTLIDPIFVDSTIFGNLQVEPFINGLFDNDAQIICLKNTNIETPRYAAKLKTQLINDQTTDYFLALLKEETWDSVFETSSVNDMYNKFQNIPLKYYDVSFPMSYVNKKITENKWITIGIKKSCTRKIELYSEYKQNKNDIQIRDWYRIYCRILKKVIIEAKNNTIIN